MGWGPSGTDEVPEHVALQCLWYMACTGLDRWDVAAFFTFTDDFRRYTMRRDRELESGIISRVGKWWQRHIVDGEPVQLDHSESAASFLADTYPEQREPLRDATEVEADLVCRAIDLREREKEIARARKTLEAQLKERIGDAEGFRLDSVKATWKSQSRTRIDTKRMRAEHPDLCKKYEVESSSRILRMVAS
jgi:predicted phage-related endonuclease